MNIYQKTQPYIELYETADDTDPKETLGLGAQQFEGDGTLVNGRLKVVVRGGNGTVWWVDATSLRDATALLDASLPPLVDEEFFDAASLAAQFSSGFRDAGGMNVEYLLLLAWVESNWQNTDSTGRSGADADLTGPLGPFRFNPTIWSSLTSDPNYTDLLGGYGDKDRIKPLVQCRFAAAYANRLQLALKSQTPSIEAPAWLLRLGHRIGEDNLIRFSQLNDGDSVSTNVAGNPAVDIALITQNPDLFPRGGATSKSEVNITIATEFTRAKDPVVQRLQNLVSGAVIDDLAQAGTPGVRTGAFGLLDFIAQYESRGSYLKVVDNKEDQLPKKLTTMTIAEVLAEQVRLGNRNACGKYQIVHGTLIGNYDQVELSPDDLFDADAQDKIAYRLLMTVRGGQAFLESDRSQQNFQQFALAVAQEWAAMPVLAPMQRNGIALQRGESYYRGVGGNAAGVSAEHFENALRKFMAEA